MRRQRVAFHGQQHDVDRHLAIRHLHRVFEQFFALAAVDEFARWRHRALRGQAIGDEDDLVRLGMQRARRQHCIHETGAIRRRDGARRGQHAVDGARVIAGQPLSLAAGEHHLGLRVEADDLELAVVRQLRRDPFHHVE